jgi:hypothetical protein
MPGMNGPPPTVLLSHRIDPAALSRLVQDGFRNLVKFVTDIERGRVTVGGELQADAELVLLEDGSHPKDLWGANYYPGKGREDCIEFTSLINIRPARDNPGMEVVDPAIREQVRAMTFELIGDGEPL